MEENKPKARKLIYIAWIIECLVVISGLSIGLSIFYEAGVFLNLASNATQIIPLLPIVIPVFLIAVAELSKIPLIEAIVTKGFFSIYSYFFILIFCLITFVTFENIFSGIEKSFYARQTEFEKSNIAIIIKKQESDGLILQETDYQNQIQKSFDELTRRNQEFNDTILVPYQVCIEAGRSGCISPSQNPRYAQQYVDKQNAEAEINRLISEYRERIEAVRREKKRIELELLELQAAASIKAFDNQIVRFTALLYGIDDASKVTKEQTKLVSLIFMVSVALASVLTGSACAFAYYVINKPKKQNTVFQSILAILKRRSVNRQLSITRALLRREQEKYKNTTDQLVKSFDYKKLFQDYVDKHFKNSADRAAMDIAETQKYLKSLNDQMVGMKRVMDGGSFEKPISKSAITQPIEVPNAPINIQDIKTNQSVAKTIAQLNKSL